MNIEKSLSKELQTSLAWTAALTILFIFFNRSAENLPSALVALPFFVVLYFFIFSIGKENTSVQIRNWINGDIKKAVILPAALITIYFAYVFILKQNPFQGAVSMIPYLVFFPVLVFAAHRSDVRKIDWLDFTTIVLFLIPITLIDANPAGKLPETGHEFDSVYRIMMMLVAIYAFATVRELGDVGFFPEFKLKSLFTATWVWLAFYGFIFIIGYSVDFIQFKGHETFNAELLTKIALTLVTTFLHTALFEELFFRGLLQNMLAKRIDQAKTWITFWKWGLAILTPLAILVGYTLDGGMQWFPALVTLLIFMVAFYIERSGAFGKGVYTALAITGVIFGLELMK